MMITWSPHTGSHANSSPEAVIRYLLSAHVKKNIEGRRVAIERNPAPELLMGTPEFIILTLRALRQKHRYSVSTLSFAPEDVSVDAFNDFDPEVRRDVYQALGLFFEVAYAGIPTWARLRPLIGTHTHTGRLEVNILMLRVVTNAAGRVRAYNPHPPGERHRRIWDACRDVLNMHFGWADPLDESRRKMTKASDMLLKLQREAARSGGRVPDDPGRSVRGMAECLVEWGKLENRGQLVNNIISESDSRLIPTRTSKDTVTFYNRETSEMVRLGGFYFSDAFTDGNLLTTRKMDEYGVSRRAELAASPTELGAAMARRAIFNSAKYGHAAQYEFDPLAILSGPSPQWPFDALSMKGMQYGTNFNSVRTATGQATREIDGRAGGSHPGAGRSGRGVGNGAQGHAADARLFRCAQQAATVFERLRSYLLDLANNLRHRQTRMLLAQGLARASSADWKNITKRLEALNDLHLTSSKLAGTSGRTPPAHSADRAAAKDHGSGRSAGPVRAGGSIRDGNQPDPRADGAGRDRTRSGYRDTGKGASAHLGNGKPKAEDGTNGSRNCQSSAPDGSAGAEQAGALTRGELISIARKAAREQGVSTLRLSFVNRNGQQWLRAEADGVETFFDGSCEVGFDRGLEPPADDNQGPGF